MAVMQRVSLGDDDEDDRHSDQSLSDDSTFYGDRLLRSKLEEKASQFDSGSYWSTHHLQLSLIARKVTAFKESESSATRSLYNIYQGDLSGRQLDETVHEFLTRLPPLTTPIDDVGPWIYIADPHSRYRSTDEHRAAMDERAQRLLRDFEAAKSDIESAMLGKSQAAITRKITPLRSQLKNNLLTLATETGCSSGKWMMFPSPDEVNDFWSLIAKSTAVGELGFAAKVATDDLGSDRSTRLICVYTDDFRDTKSIKRVLETLFSMGLGNRRGLTGERQRIYYKADIYTHLSINRDNRWGLKPSLYSSADILAGTAKWP